MQKGPTTPKGFRDINPELAKKRRQTINTIADVLESYDFLPLETPTIEFAETLTGKYGDEEKLIYKFIDRGERELALRYDLTVPLARYIANNLNVIANGPFRRYQTGNVFRGENTQKGRYREFTQFDMDTVGSTEPREDAKVIAAAIKAARKIGLANAKMAINDRANFEGMNIVTIRAIDKIYKIGIEAAKKEVLEKGLSQDEANKIDEIQNAKLTENLKKVFEILEKDYELKEGQDFFFDPTLARGLDYYTSTILELKPNGKPEEQSIGGGGRYNELIGIFAGKKIPAVGFSFGIDRIMEILS